MAPELNTEVIDEDGFVLYWYEFTSSNFEYPLAMVETTHYMFAMPIYDKRIPRSYSEAVKDPPWAAAITTETDKFDKNKCLTLVIYTGQHLVPMQ